MKRATLPPSLPWRCQLQAGMWIASQGFHLGAHAVDLAPAGAVDDEQLRVPGVAVNGRNAAGIDLVHQRVEAARRRVAVRAHVDAAAHAARRRLERHVFLAHHGAPVLAPAVDELGAALLLDVVVRDGGGGLGFAHRGAPGPVSVCGTLFCLKRLTIEYCNCPRFSCLCAASFTAFFFSPPQALRSRKRTARSSSIRLWRRPSPGRSPWRSRRRPASRSRCGVPSAKRWCSASSPKREPAGRQSTWWRPTRPRWR